VFISVAKRGEGGAQAVYDLARQFAWNGISAEAQVIPANGGGVAGALSASAEDCGADLVVMGAYGHSRVRELIFGSCTDTLIRDTDRPILLMH
jgi:nucleotide-binding universal stress UspA family protein